MFTIGQRPCHTQRLAIVMTMWVLVACESRDTPVGLSAARGGIPGPPPGVILPPDIGPPPDVPRRPGAGPPSFLASWASIGVGSFFSCGLLSDGTAYCWGRNDRGQLGDGTSLASTMPVAVDGGHVFDQLAVGDNHSCGVDVDGAAYCWGSNDRGQLGAGLPIDFTTFSATPVPVAGSLRFVSLSAGLRTTCGTATDGATYCWGLGDAGQLGHGATGVNSAVPVMVAGSAALGLDSVTAGLDANCALDPSGALFCWGRESSFGNGSGAPTLFPTPQPAASGAAFLTIDAGSRYSCGLLSGGSAVCWGILNPAGQLGTGSLAPSLAPAAVAGGLSFAFLDANATNSVLDHTCGVTAIGTGYCWGSNLRGQLGTIGGDICTFSTIGAFDCAWSPVPVSGGISWDVIAVGLEHTCGIERGGAAYCWGRNDIGQLGDGTTTDRNTPVRVIDGDWRPGRAHDGHQ